MVPDLDSARSAFDDQRPRNAAVRPLRTVALVGIDGSGKTTQARQLATALAEWGLPATYRRNAGGRRWFGRLATALGRRDGEHLLGRKTMLFVESVLRWLAILRTLLRRSVTREVAIMDRYAVCQFASIRAHAKTPRPERLNRAERRARLAYRVFPQPDVTFLLAVDPAVAYDRIEQRGYDHEEMDYLRAATAAYQALPEHAGFVVIDANGTPEQVRQALLAHLGAFVPAAVPKPRVPAGPRRPRALLVAHARVLLVTVATLAAAASVLTYQLAEGF
ncbi:thymidylate kinase [Actinoplanes sp. ATCC 53533]|uniref:dTMP kinase n=1 Tax=Actinoplanes sp. ATCC 53533 TaxID=1288362 RepID=UPI000F783789|nr:dTMP kinase [Actinoplanes sp. ATCC 53533]RSM54058.1 thymidylate kinase [Actinoplanes sp. ATCC 53533]